MNIYPFEREDNGIEMVLFVPLDVHERDFETQVVFEKDTFYSVGGKIVPGYYGGTKRPKVFFSLDYFDIYIFFAIS